MPRERADIILVTSGLCETRAQAQRLILAGQVRSGPDQVVRKPGQLFPADAQLHVHTPLPYVSRGALKLLPALELFAPDVTGKTALDVGASTGGFTDLLLQRGVRRVYAVDVGYGQLHYRLRTDPRVVSLERVNARRLTREHVPEPIDILTVDVSFISVTKILPACAALLVPRALAFILVKPQFEAGKAEVKRGGVVRDEAVRERCIDSVTDFAVTACRWTSLGVSASPIKGPKGNQETVAIFRA